MGRLPLLIIVYMSVAEHSKGQELLFQSSLTWDSQGGKKPHFGGAIYENEVEILPFFQKIIPLKSSQVEEISLQAMEESSFDLAFSDRFSSIKSTYTPIYHVAFERGKPFLFLKFLPFRKDGSSLKK